jgi:hypothetical protein
LKKFRVWTGPGTSSNQSQGLIVDWSRGFVKRPSAKFCVYTVSFYVNGRRERLAYVVLYACEPSTNDGFVHVPGQGDPSYSLNVASVVLGVEGQWFHAWSAWTRSPSHYSRRPAGSEHRGLDPKDCRRKPRLLSRPKKSDCSGDPGCSILKRLREV